MYEPGLAGRQEGWSIIRKKKKQTGEKTFSRAFIITFCIWHAKRIVMKSRTCSVTYRRTRGAFGWARQAMPIQKLYRVDHSTIYSTDNWPPHPIFLAYKLQFRGGSIISEMEFNWVPWRLWLLGNHEQSQSRLCRNYVIFRQDRNFAYFSQNKTVHKQSKFE